MQFCHHASGAALCSAAAGQCPNSAINLIHHWDQACVRILVRIAVVQAVNITEDNQASACTSRATIAERLSLSPKTISSTATLSFSLTIGIAP